MALLRVSRAFNRGATPLFAASDGAIYGVGIAESLDLVLFKIVGDVLTPVSNLTAFKSGYPTSMGEGSDGRLYFAQSYNLISFYPDGSGAKVVAFFGYTDSTDCYSPNTGLTLASDGAVYGGCIGNTTIADVFRISSTGVYTEIHNLGTGFPNFSLQGSLGGFAAEGTNGLLYGELEGSGNDGADEDGLIYTLDFSIPKPVPVPSVFTPDSGAVGAQVTIFGNHFLETQGVSFAGGVPAPFIVESDSFLVVTVPAKAVTGPVTVTNANGTTVSKNKFVVTK